MAYFSLHAVCIIEVYSSWKLDTIYDESSEVLYVKKAIKEWQNLKVEIYNLIENLEKGLEEDNGSKNRGYFG